MVIEGNVRGIIHMIKRMVKELFARFGYEIRRAPSAHRGTGQGFMLHQYLKEDGSFNYEAYRQEQVKANNRKIGWVGVNEENIAFLAKHIKNTVGTPRFGICHGTRRGKEQEWFRKYLDCQVIGTEIADTAAQFPHTIQWDFHETRPEWIGATDFIYSNAFDHSYDPEKCLNAWMSCVKKGGLCIIEHSSAHGGGASESDPFSADIILMPYLIATWSKGRYGIRELIEAPRKAEPLQYLYFIVIQNFYSVESLCVPDFSRSIQSSTVAP